MGSASVQSGSLRCVQLGWVLIISLGLCLCGSTVADNLDVCSRHPAPITCPFRLSKETNKMFSNQTFENYPDFLFNGNITYLVPDDSAGDWNQPYLVKRGNFFLDAPTRHKPLVIPLGRPELLLDALPIEDVYAMYDKNIKTEDFEFGSDFAFGKRVGKSDSHHSSPSFLSDPEMLKRPLKSIVHDDKWTFMLKHFAYFFPSFRHAHTGLHKGFNAHFVNFMFLSPPNGTSHVQSHYDPTQVFVLQIQGRKTFRFWDPKHFTTHVSEPTRFEEVYRPSYDQFLPGAGKQSSFDVTLGPGDLLWIPRGFVHIVNSEDETSIHSSMGIMPVSTYEFFGCMADVAEETHPEDAAFQTAPGKMKWSELFKVAAYIIARDQEPTMRHWTPNAFSPAIMKKYRSVLFNPYKKAIRLLKKRLASVDDVYEFVCYPVNQAAMGGGDKLKHLGYAIGLVSDRDKFMGRLLKACNKSTTKKKMQFKWDTAKLESFFKILQKRDIYNKGVDLYRQVLTQTFESEQDRRTFGRLLTYPRDEDNSLLGQNVRLNPL